MRKQALTSGGTQGQGINMKHRIVDLVIYVLGFVGLLVVWLTA